MNQGKTFKIMWLKIKRSRKKKGKGKNISAKNNSTATFFLLSGFSFTTIHESQDSRGRGRAFLNSSLPRPPVS